MANPLEQYQAYAGEQETDPGIRGEAAGTGISVKQPGMQKGSVNAQVAVQRMLDQHQ